MAQRDEARAAAPSSWSGRLRYYAFRVRAGSGRIRKLMSCGSGLFVTDGPLPSLGIYDRGMQEWRA